MIDYIYLYIVITYSLAVICIIYSIKDKVFLKGDIIIYALMPITFPISIIIFIYNILKG